MKPDTEECCGRRDRVMADSRLVVVKVGSAVLTDGGNLNYAIMNSIGRQIVMVMTDGQADRALAGAKPDVRRRIILVSSGAVAAGRAVLRKNGIGDFANYQIAKPAIAAVGQSRLMAAWNGIFAPYGFPAAQVLLTREDLRSRKRFQTAAATFGQMLAWDVVPVVNENDTVSAGDLKFGDNDCLASLLVNLAEADLYINLTSAPGVLDANPDENPKARTMPEIDNIASLDIDSLCGAKSQMGSGGMYSKLLAARRVSQLGVPTLILPGRQENVLPAAFGLVPGEKAGTWICAAGKAIPRRKFWLAYQSEPCGEVEIDAGAVDALLRKGGSLLPGGVTAVRGNFDRGDLVRITANGQSLGVGFSNYPASDLMKIKGLKRHEVAAILGNARYPDVVHRDNLLLDAAI